MGDSCSSDDDCCNNLYCSISTSGGKCMGNPGRQRSIDQYPYKHGSVEDGSFTPELNRRSSCSASMGDSCSSDDDCSSMGDSCSSDDDCCDNLYCSISTSGGKCMGNPGRLKCKGRSEYLV
eukprot:Awhi_evm1s5052